MKIIIVALILWLVRLILNVSRLRRCYKIKNSYTQYAKRINNKALQYKDEMISLFKFANIQEEIVYDQTTRGGRVINTTPYPLFSNMFNEYAGLESSVLKCFEYAIGTYKRRIFENFNVRFWLEMLIYLPQNLLRYFGKPVEKNISNFLSFVYWIIGLFVTIYTLEIKGILDAFSKYLSSLF